MHYQGHQTLEVKYIVVQVSPQKCSKAHLLSHWWPPLTRHQSLYSSSGLYWPSEQNNVFCNHDSKTMAWRLSDLGCFPSASIQPGLCHLSQSDEAKAWIHTLLHNLAGNGVLGEARTGSLTCSPCSIHPKTTAASPSSNHRDDSTLRWSDTEDRS